MVCSNIKWFHLCWQVIEWILDPVRINRLMWHPIRKLQKEKFVGLLLFKKLFWQNFWGNPFLCWVWRGFLCMFSKKVFLSTWIIVISKDCTTWYSLRALKFFSQRFLSHLAVHIGLYSLASRFVLRNWAF